VNTILVEAPEKRTLISIKELEELYKHRLEDVKNLYDTGRYDGAFYLLGYVLEIALKRRICITLSWDGYPNAKKEFENFTSFRTHDLDNLLHLSGVEKKILEELPWAWSAFNDWSPEVRYVMQRRDSQDVSKMLLALEALLRDL
jgi:hypothetical protein